MPGSCWDHCPDDILRWVKKQEMFWVSTAPLSENGHCNVSAKSIKGTFHLLEGGRECWYEDMTGSGCETISHLRENGRITLLFTAFEGPPRCCRFFGKGTVYEYGSHEYHRYLPGDSRQPGSRSVIKIEIFKVTLSCGYTTPKYQFIEHRDTLKKFLAVFEKPDAEPEKNMQAFWAGNNATSLDGLPALQTAHKTTGTPQSAWGKEWMKFAHPRSHGLSRSAPRPKFLVEETPKKKKDIESNNGQVSETIKMLDSSLLLVTAQFDHRALFGLLVGVLLATVTNRLGIPII